MFTPNSLDIHTARTHARTTQNDFPVELSPPTSDTILHHFSRHTTFGKMPSRRSRTYFLEIWKFRYMNFGIFICSNIIEFDLKWVWLDMSSY